MPEVDPGVAALSLWCTYRDAPKKTETQGDTIFIGPAFATLPLPEQIGVLSHHVLHVALRHSARRAAMAQRMGTAFQPDLYDLACDALVNEALLQGGHALPRPVVRAADLVLQLPPEEQPTNVLAEWDADQLYFALVAQARAAVGGDQEGAAQSYATARSFEPDLGDAPIDGQEAEVWAGRVEQALAAGRAAGSGIGAALTRFGDLPKAEVPWEVRLRRLMRRALSQAPHLSHRRPARNWLAREAEARRQGGPTPVFEPSLARIGHRPRLVVGLDTSSSITDAELGLFAAEALSLVRRTGAEAHLLGFDTDVHYRGRLDRTSTLTSLEMRRGGGTDFAQILAEAQSLNPSLIVMLTDLDATLGPPPDAPVLWAVPRELRTPPHFGEVVTLRG